MARSWVLPESGMVYEEGTETWVVPDAGALTEAQATGQTIAVGQVTVTTLAQSVTRRKTVPLAQVSTAHTAQAVSRRKTVTLGQSTSLASPQVVTWVSPTPILGQVSSLQTAQAVAWVRRRLVGQGTETASVFAVGRRKTVLVSLVPTTQSAQVVSRRKTVGVAQRTEATLARPVLWSPQRRLVLGAVSSTTVQSVTWRLRRLVSRVTESTTPDTITPAGDKLIAVGQVSTVHLAQLVRWAPQRRLVTRAETTDLALALRAGHRALLGVVTETALVGAYAPFKVVLMAQASEATTASPVRWAPQRRLLGQPIEAATVAGVTWQQRRLVGLVQTAETVQPISTPGMYPVGLVLEAASAQPLRRNPLAVLLTQATETSLAQALTISLVSLRVAVTGTWTLEPVVVGTYTCTPVLAGTWTVDVA